MSDPTVDRLEKLQAELQQVLEDRLAELSQAIRQSETVARRIVSAELEIERHRGTTTQLGAEIDTLEQQLDAARQRAAEVRERHDALSAERERYRAEVERLRAAVAEADGEVAQARASVEGLEGEAETLRAENATLKTKLKTLEENVTRMRRLKEELMTSISGLTQEMSGLAGGPDE